MNKPGLLSMLYTKLFRRPFFFYILLFVFQTWAAIIFLQHGWSAISYPYQLDYGEGAVLDQVVRLSDWQPIYRTDLSIPPYVINVYPPVYLVAQLPFISLWGPAFWYGRAISLISTLAITLLITLTLHEFIENWAASIVGGLTFIAIPYVIHWAPLFRVDTLALFFSWGALLVIVRWPKERWSFFVTTLLLVASIYTRQSYLLAAPITTFCWLLVQSGWKRALSFLALLVSLVLGVFIVLNLATSRGFFFNTITILGKQTISTDTIWYYAQDVSNHMPYLLITTGMLVVMACTRIFESRSKAFIIPYLIGTFISALTIGKPGSNINYLIEFAAAISFSTAIIIVWLKRWRWLHILSLILLTLQICALIQWIKTDYYSSHYAEAYSESPQIMQLIQQTHGPVLTDEYLGLLLLDHRPVYIQPFDFSVLAKNELWNQQPFLDMLDRREFELIIIYSPYDGLVKQRWTKQMLEHINQNYEQVQSVGNNKIFRKRP